MQRNRYFIELSTPQEIAALIGGRARRLRLARQLRQADVAERARVSVATLQRFESTGEASFSAVLRIALALGADAALRELFGPPAPRSLDELGAGRGEGRQRASHRRRPE